MTSLRLAHCAILLRDSVQTTLGIVLPDVVVDARTLTATGETVLMHAPQQHAQIVVKRLW